MHTHISHKINTLCSNKYYSSYFDLKKISNELKKNDSLNEKDISKKKNAGSTSSELASQNENGINKKDSQKKVIAICCF